MQKGKEMAMTIDEAIEQLNEAKCGNCPTLFCEECVKGDKSKQIAEWLEELKAIKNGFTDDLLNMGYTKGYRKAIDDFVAYANTMPTVEDEDDGYIRPMHLEEMAEQLKAGGKNE